MAFGCFIRGAAAAHSGLVERLARGVIARTGMGYAKLIGGLILIGFLLSLIVPMGVARLLLILPIIISLSDELGYKAQSRGRTGLLLAGIIGTLVPSYAFLPATMPSIVLQGSAEKLFSIQFTFGDYFIANFPALVLPATLLAAFLLIFLFREQAPAKPSPAAVKPVTRREAWTLVITAGAVILWATDNVHGLPIAWIAMGAATLCLLPAVGPLRDVSAFGFMRPRTWLLLIGIMSAVTLLNLTGWGEALSAYVVDRLEFSRGNDGVSYAVLVLLSMVVSLCLTTQAAPAIFATLAKDMGLATGWPIEGILMAPVAAWVFLILPYAIPMLMIGMRTCGLRYRNVLSFVILYFLIGTVVILPLQFWWLHQLDYIP
jgi:hypothetical protein